MPHQCGNEPGEVERQILWPSVRSLREQQQCAGPGGFKRSAGEEERSLALGILDQDLVGFGLGQHDEPAVLPTGHGRQRQGRQFGPTHCHLSGLQPQMLRRPDQIAFVERSAAFRKLVPNLPAVRRQVKKPREDQETEQATVWFVNWF